MLAKQLRKYRRQKRTRAKVRGTQERPRLSVFRSNQHIYAQLIDDKQGQTLASFSDLQIRNKKKMTKLETAKEVGKIIAKEAAKKEIQKVVFDRGSYKYHGRVRALAEGAREGGLKF